MIHRFVVLVSLCALPLFCQDQPIVLKAGLLLDGKGGKQSNVAITIRDSKIASISAAGSGKPTYDLTRLTVLPGLIDTHVHIAWHLGPDGRYKPRDESPAISVGYGIENAFVTLMAGFTTVQSVGSPIDREIRDATQRGILPGPRILTSVRPVNDVKLTPDQTRELVRKIAADGADLIKMFAWTGTLIDGGKQTLSDEQIAAACDEAKKAGLRILVHVYGDKTARVIAEAGCTSVEHGFFVSDDTFRVMAKLGTYYDPNIGLVMQNYLANQPRFLGIGNYKVEEMEVMRKTIPVTLATFQRALKIPGLKIVFGTDAVAAAHGHNIEELIYRVEKGGQAPGAAIVSATSLAAESMKLEGQIGTLKPGMEADLIAVDGDPLKDIEALRRVVFVMKGGKVFKNGPR